MTRTALVALFATAAVFAACSGVADAQSFPTRPVTLIDPWPAGGATDVQLRALAAASEKHLGQPIVIENRPGASATLGPIRMAATSPPDGYTVSQIPIAVLRAPFPRKMTFDPAKDLTYIIHLIPIPDRFESNPTLANGVWIVATMPSPIQSDLEAVLPATHSGWWCAAMRRGRALLNFSARPGRTRA